MKNLAIIGASYLQLPLIRKAKEMGYTTHVFAWASDDVGEKEAEILKAEGEAEYMKILSDAYSDESKTDFYSFVRSLDALKASVVGDNKTVILSEDSTIAQIFNGK